MATTTAKTKSDVDSMDKRERLYDSLSYTYGKKGEKLASEYDKARSQADRQLLGRGMQRSSYGAQTLANIDQKKIEALDENESALIADYENRLSDIEQQEQQQANWQAQFEEGKRQYETTLAYNERQAQLGREFTKSEREAQQAWQAGENEKNRAFTTSEREAQQGWQAEQNALARAFTTAEREAQQAYNTSEREAQQGWQAAQNAIAREFSKSEREAQQAYNTSEREAQQLYNTSEREAQQAWQAGENEKSRAFTTAEREAQQAWQAGQNAISREFTTAEREAQQAWQSSENALNREFQQRQWEDQQAQWREEFDYNSKTNDQKIAYNYVVQAAANGGDVSAELLARAGLSREDYNAMKTSAQATGGGSRRSSGGGNDNPGSNTPPPTSDADVDAVFDEEEPSGTGTAKGMNGLTKEKFELGNYLSSGKANVDLRLASTLEKSGYGSTPLVINPVNGSTVEVEEIDPTEQMYLEKIAKSQNYYNTQELKKALEKYKASKK